MRETETESEFMLIITTTRRPVTKTLDPSFYLVPCLFHLFLAALNKFSVFLFGSCIIRSFYSRSVLSLCLRLVQTTAIRQ